MKLDILKNDFKKGIIHGVKVRAPDMLNDGWYVMINWGFTEELEAARGGTRTFATLDAAAKLLKEIGFSEFTVQL